MEIYKPMQKNGFTLAEVLLTLTIIGVVASITIPSLIQNTKDEQNKIAWKKAWSVVNQVNLRLQAEHNSIEESWSSLTLKDNFAKYLNVIEECDSNATVKGKCFTSENIYHPLDPSYIVSISNYCPGAPYDCTGLVTSDGMHYVFRKDPAFEPQTHFIAVDVNGFKAPNTCGKDIFGIARNRNNGKLEPEKMSYACEDNSTEWLYK